jgi:hypothetical protein
MAISVQANNAQEATADNLRQDVIVTRGARNVTRQCDVMA